VIDLTVQGGDQLYATMRQLPIELQVSELSNALKAAGFVIGDEMAAEAPREKDIGPRTKTDQHLSDSIAVQVEKNPKGSAAEVYVGPNSKIAWRAKFIELGAAAHAIINSRKRKKKVLASADQVFGEKINHPGVRPFPFMRRALDTAGPAAIEEFRKTLAKGLARVVKRISKSYAPARR
jgi:HK97 gp10 family phage protein